MKKTIKIITAALAAWALLCSSVFAEGNFTYQGESNLFSESFDSRTIASNSNGATVEQVDGRDVLKLSGENAHLSMKETDTCEYGFSADIRMVDASSGSYAGLSIGEGNSGAYRLLIYPKEKKAKILKNNTILAEKKVNLGDWNNVKIAVKDGIIRAMMNNAVVMTVYDATPLSGRGSSVSANGLTAYFSSVLLETESSYYYENFESGAIYSVNSDVIRPAETRGDAAGEWIVQVDEGKNIMTTKGYSSYSKIVYPFAKKEQSNSSAVVLNMKNSDWNAEDGNGFSIYSRYQAGNMSYRLRFYNNTAVIEKVAPSNVVTALATSAKMNISSKNYYEVAFETINDEKGAVTLNAYFDGKLAASAKDTEQPYLSGDYAIECTGEIRPYIDEINCISITEPMYKLYAEGRKQKAIDVYFNDDRVDTTVIMEGTQALMDAAKVAELAEVTVTSNTESGLVAEKYGMKIKIPANSSVYTVNGNEVDMQATAQVINGVLYVPVRAVLEPFGATVSYDNEEKKLNITYDSTLLENSTIYTKDNVILALEPDAKAIRFMKILGSEVSILGDENPIWTCYYVDNNVRALNATNWVDTSQAALPISYGQRWDMGNCTANSLQAEVTGTSYDENTGKLTINYSHKDSDVTMYFTLSGQNVYIDSTVKNKSEYPLQFIESPTGWRVNYSKNNTVIVDQIGYAIEYENVNYQQYTEGYMFNGFIVNGDNPFFVHYVEPEYGKSDKKIRATQSEMKGPQENKGFFTTKKGTIVWAEKDESRDAMQISIGVYDTLKDAAVEWCESNYPQMRTLDEKAQESIRDKMPHSYQLFSTFVKFKDMKKFADALPGMPMHHIGNKTMHKRTDKNGNEVGDYFDAFPNYFPPSEVYGTEEELDDAIGHITNDLGQMFLPRQSIYYYTEGSDFAKDIGVEDESSLAMVRIDGKPQQGIWIEPGYLASPSSKKAQEQYQKYFDKWTGMGANTFFTNVIGAITSYTHRYDFHPDAESPDDMYDAIAKQFKWYSDRNPVFTEVGSAIRVPYTAGFMYNARWGLDNQTLMDGYMNGRGNIVRTREDIFPLFFSKYIQQYPHNLSTSEGQTSNKSLSYSLLYNIHLKNGIESESNPSDSKWRAFRNVAMMADVVQPYLYGKELMSEIEYDESTGIERANYEGSIVTANLTETPYRNKNDVIAKYGFDFKSADGKVYGGIYDEYNGHAFDDAKTIMTRETDTGAEIYALTTAEAFEICVPTDIDNPKLTAHYPDGTNTELSYRKTANGIVFTYPYFDINNENNPVVELAFGGTLEVKSSKIIPYVEISASDGSQGVVSDTDAVMVQTKIDLENYSSLESLPEKINGTVRVENYSGGEISAEISVSGNYFGKTADVKIPIKQSVILENYEFELPLGDGILDSGADLKVSISGIKPMKMNDTLTVTRMQYPEMMTAEEAKVEYNIDNMVVDWNMDPNHLPEGVKFTSHGAENPYGTGYVLKNGDYLTFEGDNLIFKDKVYFEIVYKYNDLRQHDPAEQKIISPISGVGFINRQIEFRYMPANDQIRLLITSDESLNDLSSTDVCPVEDEWYHIIACYDGTTQRLIINGKEVSNKYSESLHPYENGFKVGGNMDAEIAYIRIGGK